MRTPGKRLFALGACALACAGAGGGTAALAESQAVTPAPDCCTFSPTTFTLDAGSVAQFQNLTDTTHDVTSTQKGPDGEKLFGSSQIKQGTVPINGTQYLAPGTYHFICAIHGSGMSADLIVGPGTPQARPSVGLAIPKQGLAAVVRQGKLKVTVTGKVAASGVTLTARKGAKTLGTAKRLNVPAGRTKTVTVALTAAGKRAIKNLKAASVAVTGTVPFGKSPKASRTLR